jgi:molecular chaperone HscB
MNYFELFNIPVSVTVDKTSLAKKYFELQKKFHPDFFAQEDEVTQEDALEKTSELNKAFKIFKDRDATIQYLLKIKGLFAGGRKISAPARFFDGSDGAE